MTADLITLSRIPLSFLLLFFSPFSHSFTVLYLMCGVTDVLDGFIARMLHEESEKGAMLDSMADLVFAVIYAVRILPLFSLNLWIWIWTAVIAAVKVLEIAAVIIKKRKLCIDHSFGNRMTGILLFLLPVSSCFTDVNYGAILVCIVATVTVLNEIIKICAGH